MSVPTYWGIDVPDLDEAGAEKIERFVKRKLGLPMVSILDPRLCYMDFGDRVTMTMVKNVFEVALRTGEIVGEDAEFAASVVNDLEEWLGWAEP